MKIEAKKVKIKTLDNGAICVLTDEDANENSKQLGKLEPGTVFTEGNIRFVVLEHLGNSTKVIEAKARPDMVFDEDSPDWKISELRDSLNTEVLEEYEKNFGADNIVVSETDLTTLDGLRDYETCVDKVRIITFEERRKYQHLYTVNRWEWTLTPWTIRERSWEYSLCVVSPRGDISGGSCDDNGGVRPVCILKSNIFVSLEEKANE